MKSWIQVAADSDFSLRNLPYGVFSTSSLSPRIGTAIGDYAVDLKVLAQQGVFSSISFDWTTLESANLNSYASLGRDVHRQVRHLLTELFRSDTPLGHLLRDDEERRKQVLIPLKDVRMHLPMNIGDYTDFLLGPYHAQNCNEIFRPGQPLHRNYDSLPIAYHGRASSVVVSGTEFRRPKGQIIVDDQPVFAPTKKLDFEVEFAAFIGRGNTMGEPIETADAESHIFGVVLMNDWSARDIQFWESIPLGPFNGKNFCTTVSPWIVTLDALEPFRVKSLRQGGNLAYLDEQGRASVFHIPIDVSLSTESESGRYHLFRCNTRHIVFSFAQMVAHHTANGCPLRTGDLIATGTLTGPNLDNFGCLLEATLNGKQSIQASSLSSQSPSPSSAPTPPLVRTFLLDGDEIEFRAAADDESGLGKVGFGACTGRIKKAL